MGQTCGATCGITRERERQKDAAREVVRRAYPDGWHEAPAWTPDEPPFAPGEADALARELEGALPCRAVVVRAAGEGEADWIYLVATLAETSWVEARERDGAAPEAGEEVCVRVGLSALGRYATLQEVRVAGAREGDGLWVEERRVAGIEDRRLQLFVKAAQGLLRRQRVVALDAAFLAEPVGDAAGEGRAATPWSALFDRDPMVTSVATFVPAQDVA